MCLLFYGKIKQTFWPTLFIVQDPHSEASPVLEFLSAGVGVCHPAPTQKLPEAPTLGNLMEASSRRHINSTSIPYPPPRRVRAGAESSKLLILLAFRGLIQEPTKVTALKQKIVLSSRKPQGI